MKRVFVAIALACIILCSFTGKAYAHSVELDFYEIFEEHGAVMLLIDEKTGAIEHANRAASEFYGYSIEQLESMNMSEINLLPPEEMEKRRQAAVRENGKYYTIEQRLANGDIRTVEVYSCPHVHGDKTLLFAIVQDITEKVQLEKKDELKNKVLFIVLVGAVTLAGLLSLLLYLIYRNEKIRKQEAEGFNELRKAFFDSYDSMIYLKDEGLKYVFVNKAFMDFYKKEEPAIIGHGDLDIIEKEWAEKQRETDLAVLQTMTISIKEVRWKDRVYKETKFPVKLVSGHYGVGAYIEDVTEMHNNKRNEEKNLLRNQILVDVLSRSFTSTQEQMDYVVNEALHLTESKFGYIFLYDEEKREFVLNSFSKDVMAECAIADKQVIYRLEDTGLWGEVVRQRKPLIVNDYKIPNTMKRGYPQGHVELTKFMSIPVIIDDKIVAVVGLANKELDYDYNDVYQVTALMNGIWNAKERREAQEKLAVERNRFLQTLISIGDGVMVVDLEGKIVMLNKVAEKLTGWTTAEAQGRHYKEVFVLSHEDPRYTIDDPIEGVFRTDTVQELGNHAMLTGKDGTRYYIEDSAAPVKDDKDRSTGVVLVFRDVTEKKEQRKKIEYLSYHDPLTGLYNRIYFEDALKRLDTTKNLPLSIIVGDVNGLKLTNDIFGHAAGDLLLQKTAESLRKACRPGDVIARVGGDEFTILLLNTSAEEAEAIIAEIKNGFSRERIKAVKGSISMGSGTKTSEADDILQTLKDAENRMYSVKTLDRNDVKSATIKTIIETLHESSPREKAHSQRVSRICEKMAKAMGLSEIEVRRVREAGFYHDIGKIALDEGLLNKEGALDSQDQKEMRQHPVVGYRVLNSFDDTLDLAEAILAHHEHWDGSGYPKGLKEEEIPKLARIIAVAESYDVMTNRLYKNTMESKEALQEIKNHAGKKFDPYVVSILNQVSQETVL